MASEVLSGNSNPSYTNTTGQNVRLIINSLKNCTSFSFTNSGTITVDNLSNITQTDQYTANFTNDPYQSDYGWFTRTGTNQSDPFTSNVKQLVIRFNKQTIYDNSGVAPIGYVVVNGIKYYPRSYRGSVNGWKFDISNCFDVSTQDVNVLKELALAPNESFSAVSGAYNIVVIREDGT